MAWWLVKSEPDVYGFDQLVSDKKTRWDGIRNYTARNNLRGMKKGELVLYYHTGDEKAVVGVARVTKEAYADPSSDEDWSAVDLAPVERLKTPVTLAAIKEHAKLKDMQLVRMSRLSVVPVTKSEFDTIVKLSG